jgi:predicted metal-dependent hydrolase
MPKVRSPGLPFGEGVPRHWFGGNVVATHVVNGVNLLFPAGERFFVRSVHCYADRLTDERLRARVRAFSGQEGHHAREHERFFRVLEAEGYDVARFLALYERIAYGFIERVSPSLLRLATTAACEHFTAILAETALRKRLLDRAHPTMRALLLWHAAEEIEHRDVAYDVLQTVAPSYALRVAGLALATACLGGFWALATATLLAQERGLSRARLGGDWRIARAAQLRRLFLRGIRQYLRRDFHPSQNDLEGLAADYLASAGLA